MQAYLPWYIDCTSILSNFSFSLQNKRLFYKIWKTLDIWLQLPLQLELLLFMYFQILKWSRLNSDYFYHTFKYLLSCEITLELLAKHVSAFFCFIWYHFKEAWLLQ